MSIKSLAQQKYPHGCINLPELDWASIETSRNPLSIAQFIFRWIRTNISNDLHQTDRAEISWDIAGYSDGS